MVCGLEAEAKPQSTCCHVPCRHKLFWHVISSFHSVYSFVPLVALDWLIGLLRICLLSAYWTLHFLLVG